MAFEALQDPRDIRHEEARHGEYNFQAADGMNALLDVVVVHDDVPLADFYVYCPYEI